MEDLPTPLSRVELYLAKACGMDVIVPEQPQSRLEQFLAIIAGDDSIEMPTPIGLTEHWLAYVLGVTPEPLLDVEGARLIGAQKVDVRYFAVAAGMPGATLPEAPQNRAEMYWAYIAINPPSPGVLKYVTGSNITLTDVTSTKLESVQVNGNNFQQTYSGKNLINNYSPDVVASTASWTPTATGGTISNTATFGQSVQWRPLVVVGQEYTFHAEVAQSSCFFYINTYTDNTYTTISSTYLSDGTGTITKNFTPDTQYLRIRIAHNAAMSNVLVSNLQLEEGASYTGYEPYVGGIPSPNPDYPQPINVVTGEQTVVVRGKNLFDKDATPVSTVGVTVSVLESGIRAKSSFTGNAKYATYILGDISPYIGKKIIVNANMTASGTNNPRISIGICKSDGSNKTLRKTLDSSGSGYFDVTEADMADKPYLFAWVYSNFNSATAQSGDYVDYTDFQIEVSDVTTPSSYQPYYQTQTYTVDLGSTKLCKIGTYQDYIYKSGGNWYVHKATDAITVDGAYGGYNATFNWFYLNPTSYGGGITTREAVPMSNYFTGYDATTFRGSTTLIGCSTDVSLTAPSLLLRNTAYTSKDAYVSWLVSVTPTVYYVLATPTDTKITDSTLISQLNALAGATLHKGTTYITVGATSPNLPAELKIGYYGEAE